MKNRTIYGEIKAEIKYNEKRDTKEDLFYFQGGDPIVSAFKNVFLFSYMNRSMN